MNYKGYELLEYSDRVVVKNIKDFNLVHTFECGQCFRWIKQKDSSFIGVVKGKVIRVKLTQDILEIYGTNIEDFINIWFDYFDLGRDYGLIKEKLSQIDSMLAEAVQFGWGIRLLKQDIWEALICFIISANNKIPRIMKIVQNISIMCGKKTIFKEEEHYSFPTVEAIVNLDFEELLKCKAGFRSKYILQTAKDVLDKKIDLYNFSKSSTVEARNELIALSGVGEKIADCVLLFSGSKYDVFPIDVWVKRVMEEIYFKKETSIKDIRYFANQYFGDLVGFAQQYLFYYAREKSIGKEKHFL